MATTLLVRRDRIPEARLSITDDSPLEDGEIRVTVDGFALTANNITYAAFGDAMGYWQLFPSAEKGFGVVPAWGFGQVSESRHPGVAIGERLYGCWPMADGGVLRPANLTAAGFRDGAQHRAGLDPLYNQYLRCQTDLFYRGVSEPLQAVLRPLFTTSFLIDDFLAENQFFGAEVMLVSSASSKTACGTAAQLSRRAGIEVVGLTSPANQAFCEGLGCYRHVVPYDAIAHVPAETPCAYLDFTGNGALRREIHARFVNLRHSSAIGATHVERLGRASADLPGPRVTRFFAPAQLEKRQRELGQRELGKRLMMAWHTFRQRATQGSRPWIEVEQHRGPQAVLATYARVLGGRGDPRKAYYLSLR